MLAFFLIAVTAVVIKLGAKSVDLPGLNQSLEDTPVDKSKKQKKTAYYVSRERIGLNKNVSEVRALKCESYAEDLFEIEGGRHVGLLVYEDFQEHKSDEFKASHGHWSYPKGFSKDEARLFLFDLKDNSDGKEYQMVFASNIDHLFSFLEKGAGAAYKPPQ